MNSKITITVNRVNLSSRFIFILLFDKLQLLLIIFSTVQAVWTRGLINQSRDLFLQVKNRCDSKQHIIMIISHTLYISCIFHECAMHMYHAFLIVVCFKACNHIEKLFIQTTAVLQQQLLDISNHNQAVWIMSTQFKSSIMLWSNSFIKLNAKIFFDRKFHSVDIFNDQTCFLVQQLELLFCFDQSFLSFIEFIVAKCFCCWICEHFLSIFVFHLFQFDQLLSIITIKFKIVFKKFAF